MSTWEAKSSRVMTALVCDFLKERVILSWYVFSHSSISFFSQNDEFHLCIVIKKIVVPLAFVSLFYDSQYSRASTSPLQLSLYFVPAGSTSIHSYSNHRKPKLEIRASANIGIVAWLSKYKDLYGKKPILSVTYENVRISIKNSLPYLKSRASTSPYASSFLL